MKAGTTQEQWDRYKEDLANHTHFIKDYKFFLDRICRHLQFVQNSKAWTTAEIMDVISREISNSDSMDAPNEPGYYRANND